MWAQAGLLVGGILLGVAGLLADIYSGLKKCIGHIECGKPFGKRARRLLCERRLSPRPDV